MVRVVGGERLLQAGEPAARPVQGEVRHPATAAERHRETALRTRAGEFAAGHADPVASDEGVRYALGAGVRSRGDQHAERG